MTPNESGFESHDCPEKRKTLSADAKRAYSTRCTRNGDTTVPKEKFHLKVLTTVEAAEGSPPALEFGIKFLFGCTIGSLWWGVLSGA